RWSLSAFVSPLPTGHSSSDRNKRGDVLTVVGEIGARLSEIAKRFTVELSVDPLRERLPCCSMPGSGISLSWDLQSPQNRTQKFPQERRRQASHAALLRAPGAGLEPATYGLTVRRAANCATPERCGAEYSASGFPSLPFAHST